MKDEITNVMFLEAIKVLPKKMQLHAANLIMDNDVYYSLEMIRKWLNAADADDPMDSAFASLFSMLLKICIKHIQELDVTPVSRYDFMLVILAEMKNLVEKGDKSIGEKH